MTASAEDFCRDYARRLQHAFQTASMDGIAELATALLAALQSRTKVFLAGNGGSAGNAIHLANDFLYGIAKDDGFGSTRRSTDRASTSSITSFNKASKSSA